MICQCPGCNKQAELGGMLCQPCRDGIDADHIAHPHTLPKAEKGRYNEDESKVGADKRLLGDIPNEGKSWSSQDLSRAWTMWLDGAGDKTIARTMGRSLKSIRTFIPSKVCNPTKHLHDMVVVIYQGDDRTDRVFWTRKDDIVLDLCLKSGLSLEVIGVMLGRKPSTVADHIQKRQNKAMPKLGG